VNTAEFNDLCHREFARDKGDVVRLHLTQESYAVLLADVLGNDDRFEGDGLPDGICGARLDAMTNPATRTVVKVVPAGAFVPDTAEVAGPDGQIRAVQFT
jgi:hypothetical protein